MDITRQQPIHQYKAGQAKAMADSIVTETRIELDINDGQFHWAMLCLPRDLDALAVGFLRSEGVISSRTDISEIDVQPDSRRIHVRGNFNPAMLESLTSRWTWGTGCGGGGTGHDLEKPVFTPASAGAKISVDQVLLLEKEFEKRGQLWRQTGGVHACAMCGPEGLTLFAEDVGRHNAFDKIVGRALLDDISLVDKFIIATGRLSAEIVSKAVACGVSTLVSRSSVTGLAVDLAKKFHLTLIGFARSNRVNVYTGFDRIVTPGEKA